MLWRGEPHDVGRHVINGFRKAVDGDLVEELEEMGVQVVEWYELLGWKVEPRIGE
jgi:hypothetical protein